MRNLLRFQNTLMILMAVSAVAWSQVPQLINYQALLTNPSTGEPLPDGTYSVVFSIYDTPGGGSAVWTETQNVATNDGLYSVLLGSITPLTSSILSGPQKYLGVKVGSDPEMTPRKRIVSTAYAIISEEADKLDGQDAADFAAVSHDHDGRYYTETELNTSDGNPPNQGSNRVSWNNLKDMPGGFADGVDDTSSAIGDGNTLDQAYDQGGAGLGRTINADAGAVNITGTDGLTVSGNIGIGITNPGAKLHVFGGDIYMQGGGYNFVPSGGGNADIAFYRGGVEPNSIATLRRFADEHTVFQILSPPETFFNAYETTLALVRGDEPNVELVDFYNNGYPSETQFGIRMQKRGTGQYRDFVFDYSDGTSKFEVMRLTPSGKVGIGTKVPDRLLHVVNSTSDAIAMLEMYRNGTNADALVVRKGRGSASAPSAVLEGDGVLEIAAQGYDGSGFKNAAQIKVAIDAAPGTNDMPGRISFLTTTDGSSSPSERMRITNNGNVGIGTTNPDPGAKLDVEGDISLRSKKLYFAGFFNPGYYMQYITSSGLEFVVNSNNNLFLDVNGNAGIGTTSTGAKLEIAGDLKIVDGTQGAGKILTSDANGLASWQTPSGGGDGIPSGVIVMWSGSIASIPSGWALCDGTIGTPDLRDRFIAGAGSTYNVGDTGGEAMHTLSVDEMPSHNHNIKLGGQQGGGRPFTAGGIAISTGSTEAAGNGQSHENRPPYYALAYIMKL